MVVAGFELAAAAVALTGCNPTHHAASTSTTESSSTSIPGGMQGEVSCSNDFVSPAVLDGLVAADGRPTAAELPGYTFYANCGDSYYATAAIVAGPLATPSEMEAFGYGSPADEFFTRTGGSTWKLAGRSMESYRCESFDSPASVRAMWANCEVPLHPDASGLPSAGDQAKCRDYTGRRTYARISSVQVRPDGSANLLVVPQEVHCGGPDDLQYNDAGAAPETLHLLPGSPVGIYDISSSSEQAEPIAQLSAYLRHPESGTFEVFGDAPNMVTGLAEAFHP